MATSTAQRAAIWVIAIVMTVGTIGMYVAAILGNQNDQNQVSDLSSEQSLAAQKKLLCDSAKQRADTSMPLDGYSAVSFDSASVKELAIEDLVTGTGTQEASAESTVNAKYFGWTADGKIFDSSNQSGTREPTEFSLAQVITGWTEGLKGAKAGTVRKLTIPAEKAYGSADDGTCRPIGPLQFIVEVVEVK